MLDWLKQDIGYAVRSLRRAPGFTAAAVLTLALGVGVTTAVYTVVDALLVQPLPTPPRLVMVWETDRDSGTTREPGSYPDLLDFQQRTRTLDRLAAFIATDVNLAPDTGDPVRLASMSTSATLLPLLGVSPVAGRHFSADEDRPGGGGVAIISERLAASLFQSSTAAVGRSVRINGQPRTVIGVAPAGADFGVLQILSASTYGRGFAARDPRATVDVWLPLQASVDQLPRETHPLLMVGRLAPDASVDAAQQELTRIAADLERQYPENQARGVHLEPLRSVIVGPVQGRLLVLMAAVALLLVIACVNVANLVLARATSRAQNVAVRAALGASFSRLVRQFLAESAVLVLLAVLAGILLRSIALRALVALTPAAMPRVELTSNVRVFAVAVGVWAVTSVIFALLPLRHVRRSNLHPAMGGRTGSLSADISQQRSRAVLVAGEIALAVALVMTAGLLTRSFWTLQQVDPGFATEGIVKAELQLPASRYPVDFGARPSAPATTRFNETMLERIRALPDVTAVGLAWAQPLDVGFTNSFVIPGREEEGRNWPEISLRVVSPGYLETLRVPLLRGRAFTAGDTATTGLVALINDAAAKRFFPGQDPTQHEIRFWGVSRRIVGVIGDEKFQGLSEPASIAVYVPFDQVPPASGSEALVVRTTGSTAALVPAIRSVIRDIDPGLPVFGAEPLAETLSRSTEEQRFTMLLLVVFAANALLLAAIGIHGVLSFVVTQRTREIGVRMALGATTRQTLALIVSYGARMTAAGCVGGILLGVALGWTLRSLLFGVGAADGVTIAGVLVTMTITALAATYLPARRVSRVDPVIALRAD